MYIADKMSINVASTSSKEYNSMRERHAARRRIRRADACKPPPLLLLVFCALLLLSVAAATETTGTPTAHTTSPYVLIIDGGSTGSRLHCFRYQHPNETTANLVIDRIASSRVFSPLTDFVNASATELANHLIPLFTEVQPAIPAVYQNHHTRVYYVATAGMRLVPEPIQQQVYHRMTVGLEQHADFSYRIGRVFTLSGDMEALYGLLACNYLNSLQNTTTTVVGALDMGGASTQVAVPLTTTTTTPLSMDNVYAVSHLAYGVDQFREKNLLTTTTHCQNPGTTGHALGNATRCRALLRRPLQQARSTLQLPTSSNNNKAIEFWAMSLYFFTFDSIRHYMPGLLDPVWPTPTLTELWDAVSLFCATPLDQFWQYHTTISPHPFTHNRDTLAERCYQGVYMLELLHQMGFRHERNIRFLLQVQGSEVEWTLGMALALEQEASHTTTTTTAPVCAPFPGCAEQHCCSDRTTTTVVEESILASSY